MRRSQSINWLVATACVTVVSVALHFISSVLIPLLLAVFTAILISPLISLLAKYHINRVISFVLLTLAFLAVMYGFFSLVYNAAVSFAGDIPQYQEKFVQTLAKFNAWVGSFSQIHIDLSLLNVVDLNKMLHVTTSLLKQTSSIITNSFLVFLLTIFMLTESQLFRKKALYLAKTRPQTLEIIKKFTTDLKHYLIIKTISSVATGVLLFAVLSFLNLPYAALWGIVAFVLNYIPTFGSIIAAIPAIFVSLVTLDIQTTLLICVLYLVINIAIGNFIEPKFLGDGLDLSIIVVILSLLFWGLVLGVGGMFLAVPLTMSLKIALASNPNTKVIAVMMSKNVE